MTELINTTTVTPTEPEADLGALGLAGESEGIAHESRSPLRLALRRFRRNWVAMVALVVLVIVVFLCLFPSIPARYGQAERLPVTDTTYINAPPSAEAWWYVVPPGLCITVLVLAIAVLGYLFEEYINPRLQELG